tara:strand:+ start:47 stop:373 length:327 start_codon:yes stop_codon:yes gene_type:complete
MASSDDATKAWVSATPVVDGDSKVISWNCKYKYTLAASGKDDFVHTFDKTVEIEPTKAKTAYTKAELLTLMDKDHWDDMFNKKYAVYIATPPTRTVDASFDVSGLSDS